MHKENYSSYTTFELQGFMVAALSKTLTGKTVLIYNLTCLNSCNYSIIVINTRGTKN